MAAFVRLKINLISAPHLQQRREQLEQLKAVEPEICPINVTQWRRRRKEHRREMAQRRNRKERERIFNAMESWKKKK